MHTFLKDKGDSPCPATRCANGSCTRKCSLFRPDEPVPAAPSPDTDNFFLRQEQTVCSGRKADGCDAAGAQTDEPEQSGS
ncbi:hypothetical protein [Chitinophaga solisilvae]|uniref:hypothetical protein n=1 Tax=Chitinophaga solisilvae TaxID=1233460 RepID=UPI00136BB8F0|nr:hypothetical protein [Chitinophaga solisilvae]